MPNKRKKYNVIFIEDDPTVFETLDTPSRRNGLVITHFTNGEEGFEALESSRKYKGLILDGSCFEKKEDEIPEDAFLYTAINRLKDIQNKQNRYIPTIVYTGYKPQFEKYIKDDEIKIYSKSDDSFTMLNDLKEKIKKTEEQQILIKYSDIFDFFDKGYLPEKDEMILLSLIKDFNTNDPTVIWRNIGNIRPIMESFQKSMNKVNPKVSPNNFSFNDFRKHLGGNRNYNKKLGYEVPTKTVYVEDYLYELIKMLYSITSIEGNHHSKNKLTKYSYNALVNGLLEVLVWFGNWMDDQFKK